MLELITVGTPKDGLRVREYPQGRNANTVVVEQVGSDGHVVCEGLYFIHPDSSLTLIAEWPGT